MDHESLHRDLDILNGKVFPSMETVSSKKLKTCERCSAKFENTRDYENHTLLHKKLDILKSKQGPLSHIRDEKLTIQRKITSVTDFWRNC